MEPERVLARYSFWCEPYDHESEPEGRREMEDRLYRYVREHGEELRLAIQDDVRRQFGNDVHADVTWRKGSVIIEVVLAVVAGATAYKNMIELLDWYRDHLQKVILHFVGRSALPHFRIDASLVPGPSALDPELRRRSQPSVASLVLPFAVLGAALTAFLFWLFVTH